MLPAEEVGHNNEGDGNDIGQLIENAVDGLAQQLRDNDELDEVLIFKIISHS